MVNSKDDIKKQLAEAKRDYKEVGGWSSFKSGRWLWQIIQKSFANYWNNANVEYFESKYGTNDKAKLAKKLIAVAAKNSAVLGGVTGAAISADEIVVISTGGGGGVGLPVNIAIAATAIGAEAILLIRFQLQLVANLGKLYSAPLDSDDPEDILTILAFALGGSAADAAGKFGMKVGGKLAGRGAKAVFKKETLAALKRIAAKVGVKILQRSIVKYTIPIASIGIGTGWNYASTKTVARIAIRHFEQRT
ncbi:MAG: hypothetical protein V3T99_00375 [Nitrososphaerales archaeon]